MNALRLNNDEITFYQMVHKLNEAVWRIFGFIIREREHAVIHIAIHLENGQHVFFTNKATIYHAINPPKTTLSEFFKLNLNCVIVRTLSETLHEHCYNCKHHTISHRLK